MKIDKIKDKLEANEPISKEDGLFLFESGIDMHLLGRLADIERYKRTDSNVFYNVNSHLNPTNRCRYRCPLCAFSCDKGDAREYVMNEEEILQKAANAVESGASELHIVGGIDPELSYEWYLGIIRSIHEQFPKVHIKAWTAVEIAAFAEMSGQNIEAVLREMIDAGLRSMPGGGAEIFDPKVRKIISPKKIDAEKWLEVHRIAHSLSLMTNASMLFGHIESFADRIDHLDKIRTLQTESLQNGKGTFDAFVPLVFHPFGTDFPGKPETRTSPEDVLITLAISRLFLHNFLYIKAYWVSFGVQLAQIALGYGANDFDGTVTEEKIHHEAGSESPSSLSVFEIRKLITETGNSPIERDSLYRSRI